MAAGAALIAAAVAEEHRGWAGPWVEDEVFGTHDPEAVAAQLERFLGAAPAEVAFYRAGVGVVCGLVLGDRSRVVVKAHRPGVRRDYLAAVQRVQAALAERGFPCPRPLAGPRPIGIATATVEQLVDDGDQRDAHEPAVRRAIAETLAVLVASARDLVGTSGLREGLLAEPQALWPTPHSRMFDFEATRAGTEWIDGVAARARRRLARPCGEVVIGHADWATKHFRFVGERVHVVYDWDSLVQTDEPRLVGEAAAAFTSTWELDVAVRPTPDEAREFVSAYERARGRAFPPRERSRLAAAAAYALAYGARCEACGDPQATSFAPGSQRDALARHADEFLRL